MKTKVITFNLMYKYKGNDKITIDLCNPPENLEEFVTEAFHSYTECTAKEYRDEDRLRFIDVIRKKLSDHKDFDTYHDEYAHNSLSNAMENGNEFSYPDDVDLSIDFAESCYREGDYPLAFSDDNMNHHDRDKAIHTIARIVKAVMEYEG